MKIFGRREIDGDEQPVPSISQLDHRLVDRDVIGELLSSGCRFAFCTQLWTVNRARSAPNHSRVRILF